MQNQIPNIPARYYFRILNILEERQISTESVLSSIQVDLKKYLTAPDLTITQEQVRQFVSFCLKYPKNYDLAFEIGRSLKVSSHNLVGYAILTSSNLEQALIYISKYFTLIIPSFRVSYFYHEDQSMELVCEPAYEMDRLTLNFHLEAIAVALHCSIHELLEDRLIPYDIFMSINEPLHIQRYQKLSKVKFHFNTLKQPSFKVRLSQKFLHQALRLADEETRRAIELKCQEQIYAIKNNMDLVLWLKQLLMSSTEALSMQECAQLLNISTKTLQRHLKVKNMTFQQIKIDVAMQKAQHMLSQSNKSIFEIAEELDFASASNFSRSFKLYLGCSPSSFRKTQRGF